MVLQLNVVKTFQGFNIHLSILQIKISIHPFKYFNNFGNSHADDFLIIIVMTFLMETVRSDKL